MGITRIEPGVYLADASVRVSGKQRRARERFYALQGERPKETEKRAQIWIDTWSKEQLQITEGGHERTIARAIEDFLQKKSDKSAGTLVCYRARLSHLERYCADHEVRYVRNITPAFCVGYYAWLQREFVGQGPNGKFETFVQMIRHELHRENAAITKDPTAAVTRKALPENARDVWRFTERELTALDTLMPSDEERHIFRILEWTGMRTGELLNLPMSHVDLQSNILYIKPYHIGRYGPWKPKSRRSRRRIPILAPVRASIEFLIKKNEGHVLLLGVDDTRSFFAYRFKVLRKRIAERYPDLSPRFEAMRDGDVTHWLTPHSYRKTFACRMLEAGLSFDEVRTILGHSDIYMTELYAEYSDSNIQSVAERITAALSRDTKRDTFSHKRQLQAV